MAQVTMQSTKKLRSGYDMPIIGLGVALNESCVATCEAALQNGYRLIHYGNEVEVGKAVANSSIPREEIFITTKVFQEAHGYELTLEAVDCSLKSLGVSYIDLFLIHIPKSGMEKRLMTYKALLEARDSGKIRTVGVSNYGVPHLEEIRAAGYEKPSVNQIEQKEIVAYCTEHNIVIQAFCPLIRGKFDSPLLQEVVTSSGKTAPQVLVRWSIQKGYVPLPKSSKADRVRSNAGVFDSTLSDEEMEKLGSMDKGRDGSVSWNPVNVD